MNEIILNTLNLNQVTVSVTNIERSFEFYKKIGLFPIVKSDHYARFVVPGNEATFSIHIAEAVESTTTVYFEVENVDEKYSELKKYGIQFKVDPTDQRWHWREAYFDDPDKNNICIYHAGYVRINPEWRIAESKNKHNLTYQYFNKWLQEYKIAWEEKNPQKAADLFTDSAEYYETPFDNSIVGKVKILEYWNEVTRLQKDIEFNYEIIKVQNNIGYCKWSARFTRVTNLKEVKLEGIFEVIFEPSGLCKLFKEWWHRKEE